MITIDLQEIQFLFKPTDYKTLIDLDDFFKRIHQNDHEVAFHNTLLSSETEDSDKVFTILNLFRETAIQVLTMFGVELNTDEEISLYKLSKLLDGLESIVSPDYADVLLDIQEEDMDGVEFLIAIMTSLELFTASQLYPIIDDYDPTSIITIKRKLELDLSESEERVIHRSAERTKAYYKTELGQKADFAKNFITARDPKEAFGYNFRLALSSLIDGLEASFTIEPDATIGNLVLLALGSSMEYDEFYPMITELLEMFLSDELLIMQVSGRLRKEIEGLNKS